MSASVKVALKAAKSAIQSKKFEEGLNHCLAIFEKDPGNYNGLIFAGLCSAELKNVKQSKEYYIQAIKTDDQKLLSYQGLANLYSNQWDNVKNTKDDNLHQIFIFNKVLEGFSDIKNEKYINFSINLSKAHKRLQQFESSLIILQQLFETPGAEFKQRIANEVLSLHNELPAEIVGINKRFIKEIFLFLLEESNEIKQIYFNFLCFTFTYHEEVTYELFMQVTQNLHSKFSDEVLFYKVLILLKLQNPDIDFADQTWNFTFENDDFCQLRTALSSTKPAECQTILNSLPTELKHLPATQFKLAMCLFQSHDYRKSQNVSKFGVNLCENFTKQTKPTLAYPSVPIFDSKLWIFKFSIILAKSMCNDNIEKTVRRGVETFQDLIKSNPNNIDLYIGLAAGALKSNDVKLANEAISNGCKVDENNNIDLMCWKLYLEWKNSQNAEEVIIKLKELADTNSTLFLPTFFCGKVMWETGDDYVEDRKMCFTYLVKSAKIEPQNDEVFTLLGALYKDSLKDSTRAKSCLEKACSINKFNIKSAMLLSEIYMNEKKFEEADLIYEKICDKLDVGSNRWAWLRRGLIKLKSMDFKTAIKCFLSLLTNNRDDYVCWECLGQAYFLRGSYSAAWKAFSKASILQPTSLYSLYQMASISKLTRNFDKAIREFQSTLNLSNTYLPALKGLGESYFFKAKSLFEEGRYELGMECISYAIENLVLCCHKSTFSCIKKLIGDCCMLVTELDVKIKITVPQTLLKDKFSSTTLTSKSELLNLASMMYVHALQVGDKSAALWHDIGVCYTKLSRELNDVELAKKSLELLKMSVQLDPENSGYWCALGVASMNALIDEKLLSQHCFIKSIQKDQNNPIAWVNLGVLYLHNSNVELAHQAFKQAQNIEPSLVNSWIGQAIVAETIGSNEAIDLYRHSTQLGLHPEGSCGYASWVTQLVIDKTSNGLPLFKDNIVNMNAVHTATSHMGKICYRNFSNYWNHSIYGILSEHLGLYHNAATSYENALNCLQQLKNTKFEDKEKLDSRILNTIINLVKVYSQSGKHEKMKACMAGIKLDDSKAEHLLVLCHALFNAGLLQNSLELYKKAGTICKDENSKFAVMVAMAIINFKMGNMDQAKSLLYSCFKSYDISLYTLSALAITLKDETLIGACIKELIKINIDSASYCGETMASDICLLIATGALICKKYNVGLFQIQKALRSFPNNHATLRVMSLYLKAIKFKRSSVVYRMATKSLFHLTKYFQNNLLHDVSENWLSSGRHRNHVKAQNLVTYMALCSGNYSFDGCVTEDVVLIAQKLVHMHPYLQSGLGLLQLALSSKRRIDVLEGRAPINLNLKFLSQNLNDSSREWMNIFNALENLGEKVTVENNLHGILSSLCEIKSKTENEVDLVIQQIDNLNTPMELLIIGSFCKNLGMLKVALNCFIKTSEIATNDDIKFVCYLRLCHTTAIGCMAKENKYFWVDKLQTFVSVLAEMSRDNPRTILFQGILLKIQKNLRKARNVLSRLVYSDEIDQHLAYCQVIAAAELKQILIEREDNEDLNKLNEHLNSLKIQI